MISTQQVAVDWLAVVATLELSPISLAMTGVTQERELASCRAVKVTAITLGLGQLSSRTVFGVNTSEENPGLNET